MCSFSMPSKHLEAFGRLLEAANVVRDRRLSGPNFLAALRDPRVIALVETRISSKRVDDVCRNIEWKPRASRREFGSFEISRRGEKTWVLSGSPHASTRLNLWRDLEDFALINNRPWIIAGDVPLTIRSRPSPSTQRASEVFALWIDTLNLVDLGYHGPKLDRALCNVEWRLRFPEASVHHLIDAHSDHSPTLICASGPKNTRPLNLPFMPFLTKNWRPDLDLSVGLDTLATNLLTWNREIFGNIFKRKRPCYSRTVGVQRRLEVAPSMVLIKLERRLRIELSGILEQEQTLWWQKSRAGFLIDNNRNTKFFHTSTVIRRKANKFTSLHDEVGNMIEDLEALRNLALTHFAHLYMAESLLSHNALSLGTAAFLHFSRNESDRLDRPFSNSEILVAFKGMTSGKSLGPDDYPALFYQHNWNAMGPACTDMVFALLNGNSFLRDGAYAFLFPIAKVDSPKCMNHLRPIALLNVNFKLATKVTVNRLKPLMMKLIAPTQSSFIPCRQICDNILVVQEVLHSMRSRADGKRWMTLKIDPEKAYDRVLWDFLESTLVEAHLPTDLI
ncbi:hypothetical protein V2J09_003686 [Rumex salicifolius]